MPKAREKLIVPREKYLTAGVHIGMTSKTSDMKRFIYKVRPSGLAVLNIGLLDKRLEIIANLLAETKKILVVSRKEAGHEAVVKFAEAVGAKAVPGRFMPGSLTNPAYKEFSEPDIVIVTDPLADKQAIKESMQMRIPMIGLCDTFNDTSYLDFVLPCNNKGKKSLDLIYEILAKLILEKRDKGLKPRKKKKEESAESSATEETQASSTEEPSEEKKEKKTRKKKSENEETKEGQDEIQSEEPAKEIVEEKA